jgi:hypothetical protein
VPPLGAPGADLVFGRQHGCKRRQFGHAVGLDEAHTGQSRHGAVEHRLGDRRGAIEDLPQRGEIVFVDARMIDEHLDHRRHQERIGDAEALDRLCDCLRREAFDDYAGAAARQRAVHAPAVGDVKHRRRVQVDPVGWKQTFGQA